MNDEQYHKLVLELASAAIQEFGWHAGEYPEGSEERHIYEALESKSNDLFHAAWDRTIDKSLEGYDENMNKGDENLDKHYQNCPGCLCDLRAENDQLKKTILSSSDLYEKLVTKQLQAERELADELAKSLRECMTWWDDEFYDSDTVLKKYDERRAMDEEQ